MDDTDQKENTGTGTAVLDKPMTPTPQPASGGNPNPPTLPTAVGSADADEYHGDKPVDVADIDDTPHYVPEQPSEN